MLSVIYKLFEKKRHATETLKCIAQQKVKKKKQKQLELHKFELLLLVY